MKFYLVRNKMDGSYLQLQYHHSVSWVPKNEATVYITQEAARSAEEFALFYTHSCNYSDDAEGDYEIIEIDTDAAIKVLHDLFEVQDLGDYVYDIREREGLGWEGPQVTKWGNAVSRAKELLKRN